ncbi:hypothetical protein GYB57_04085 [bacterium]|nr:hypothetical protein [bacterium]
MHKKSAYNPDKHNRRSIRLKGYDYSSAGLYFITICCQNRISRFGHIENGTMILNEFGRVANDEWLNTPNIRKNIQLGEFIIMPNHMHGIIRILHAAEFNLPNSTGELHSPKSKEFNQSDHEGVCKTPPQSPQSPQPQSRHTPQSPSQTIGAIVRGYKSSVTKQLKSLGLNDKLWQRNYHEHIIRNDKAHENISNYIINNPQKWDNDKFYNK